MENYTRDEQWWWYVRVIKYIREKVKQLKSYCKEGWEDKLKRLTAEASPTEELLTIDEESTKQNNNNTFPKKNTSFFVLYFFHSHPTFLSHLFRQHQHQSPNYLHYLKNNTYKAANEKCKGTLSSGFRVYVNSILDQRIGTHTWISLIAH